MKTNLLVALANIIKNPITDVVGFYHSATRANSMGDALEYYVKDIFCGSISENNLSKKNEIYSRYFSYLGNQNNPPDIIIKEGDAIEVKKIENLGSALALNSSYPKDKIYADSPMITQACRSCEEWAEKDILYVIGSVIESKLKVLWFVYGDCYAASKNIYEKIKNKLEKGINELENIEFTKTKELGKVKRIDPLGITSLRIRGMWHIENPLRVFDYVAPIDIGKQLNVATIVTKDKYNAFPQEDRKAIEQLVGNNFSITDIKIKSPNNPAKLIEAKLLKFIK